jgi:hypothetical protein
VLVWTHQILEMLLGLIVQRAEPTDGIGRLGLRACLRAVGVLGQCFHSGDGREIGHQLSSRQLIGLLILAVAARGALQEALVLPEVTEERLRVDR